MPKQLTYNLIALFFILSFSSYAQAKPELGTTKTFKDWVVGCDNTLDCRAIGLVPEGKDFDEFNITMMVDRSSDPNHLPIITIYSENEITKPVLFEIDNHETITIPNQGDKIILEKQKSLDFIEQIKNASILQLTSDGQNLGTVSLAGLTASLRYIDAKQHRIETKKALIDKGNKDNKFVSPKPPVINMPKFKEKSTSEKPLTLDEAQQLSKRANCYFEYNKDTPEYRFPNIFPLDKENSIVILGCDGGAYNMSEVIFIASNDKGKRRYDVATFDYISYDNENEIPRLVNTGWDENKKILSSFSKSRGSGDCGNAGEYVWDGSMFRLIRAETMPECRGRLETIRIFKAKNVY